MQALRPGDKLCEVKECASWDVLHIFAVPSKSIAGSGRYHVQLDTERLPALRLPMQRPSVTSISPLRADAHAKPYADASRQPDLKRPLMFRTVLPMSIAVMRNDRPTRGGTAQVDVNRATTRSAQVGQLVESKSLLLHSTTTRLLWTVFCLISSSTCSHGRTSRVY